MDHQTHPDHDHAHGADCGHTAVTHNGHTDYLHDGHLHNVHGDHVDEHRLDASNAGDANHDHRCEGHDADHRHGAACGHEAVPHGDHSDYLVDGHLHFTHDEHCDEHGTVSLA